MSSLPKKLIMLLIIQDIKIETRLWTCSTIDAALQYIKLKHLHIKWLVTRHPPEIASGSARWKEHITLLCKNVPCDLNCMSSSHSATKVSAVQASLPAEFRIQRKGTWINSKEWTNTVQLTYWSADLAWVECWYRCHHSTRIIRGLPEDKI